MTQRDELLQVIESLRPVDHHAFPGGRWPETMADQILAVGYRKSRTITTVEEAGALPEGALIRSSKDGYVFEMTEPSYGRPTGIGIGDELTTSITEWYLPATVLYDPRAE
ncbi:hypothetical protein [Rhodococcus pyridinivorans]|uniref:hypothetical protein n=1 Tax=Rhodococcus pyridinivorans TaxID=103816 RepID=UPI003AB017E2